MAVPTSSAPGLPVPTRPQAPRSPETGSTGAPTSKTRPVTTARVRRASSEGRLVVLLAVLGVVAGRAPFVTGDLGKDEAGYLVVGGQWHLFSPGTSLYHDQWVDRPPLLITLFGLADRLGGAVPLRLLGILCAVLAVLAVADTVDHLTRARRGVPALAPARRWSPGRPAAWAAVVTAALVVTPAIAAVEVNGEVLASPFIALGCAGTVRALTTGRARPALLAGGCAVAAVLVKQNLIDALLWGGVLAVASVPALGWRRCARVVGLAALGGFLALALTAVWTLAHGTSLGGVWYAMYPFRADARALLLAHPNAMTPLRQHLLLVGALRSGALVVAGLLGLLVLLVALDVVRHGRGRPAATVGPGGSGTSRWAAHWPAYAAVLATALTLAWDAVAVDLGGSWWMHYLVEAVVPLGLATGLLAVRVPRLGPLLATGTAISAAVSVVLLGPTIHPPGGNPVGLAVGEVAHRGDTIVTVFGNSDVTHASGLSTPYPYMWWLPLAVLDPHLDLLVHTLDGPRAPTWFVDLGSTYPHFGTGAPRLRASLREHYHRVADLAGSGVWLRDGVRRNAPTLLGHERPTLVG